MKLTAAGYTLDDNLVGNAARGDLGDELAANFFAPRTLISATPATTRGIDSEMALSAASVAIAGSVVGVRGAVTIPNGTTVTAGFIYGTQGKAILAGTLNGSGANSLCGIQGQLDLSAATAITAGNVACGWFDCGATCAVAAPSTVNILQLDNTTTKLINSLIQGVADAAYFADLTDLNYGGAHWIFPATTPSTLTGKIKVNINGTPMYIPLYAT